MCTKRSFCNSLIAFLCFSAPGPDHSAPAATAEVELEKPSWPLKLQSRQKRIPRQYEHEIRTPAEWSDRYDRPRTRHQLNAEQREYLETAKLSADSLLTCNQ